MRFKKSQISAIFESVQNSTVTYLNSCSESERNFESIVEAVSDRLKSNSPGVKTAVRLTLQKLVNEGVVVIEVHPNNNDRYFITKNVLNEAISPMHIPAKSRPYNSASDASKSMAKAAKRVFKKIYPKDEVRIDGRNGWIIVNGKKAVSISSASGRQMSIEDMVDAMTQALTTRPVMSEGVLYVTRSPYGMSVTADAPDPYSGSGKSITIGEMVLALLESGTDDIFRAPQGVHPEALNKLMEKHGQGVQGGMQRWDSDVFEQYYNVDNDRVLRLYARLMNHSIQENPYEEY